MLLNCLFGCFVTGGVINNYIGNLPPLRPNIRNTDALHWRGWLKLESRRLATQPGIQRGAGRGISRRAVPRNGARYRANRSPSVLDRSEVDRTVRQTETSARHGGG